VITIWRNPAGTRYWRWERGQRCEVAAALALQWASSGKARIRTLDANTACFGHTEAVERQASSFRWSY
jgi:hypothetical protein